MIRRWLRSHHRSRTLAISLLILALLPTPWPKVEFHNVRHHDEPGQVCEYHDHLLRWHPDATGAADVAVLHWHWAWPTRSGAPAGPDHEGDGPRLHAHLADEALPGGDPTPLLVADTTGRPLLAAAVPVLLAPTFDLLGHDSPSLRPADPPALTFGATFAPRTSLTDRLQRWSC